VRQTARRRSHNECRPLHGAHAIGPSALFRLVKQLELPDFCANGLVGRQQASIAPSLALFLVLGFSILARSCEAMILAFKGAEYAAD
jgi:hypothetical protein